MGAGPAATGCATGCGRPAATGCARSITTWYALACCVDPATRELLPGPLLVAVLDREPLRKDESEALEEREDSVALHEDSSPESSQSESRSEFEYSELQEEPDAEPALTEAEQEISVGHVGVVQLELLELELDDGLSM